MTVPPTSRAAETAASLAAVDATFPDRIAWCRGVLVADPGGRETIPGPDLLDAVVLGRAVDRFGAAYPGGGRAGIVSLWAQWYLSALVPAVAAAAVLAGRAVPAALAEVRVVLDDKANPVGFVLPGSGAPLAPGDPAAPFDALARDHVEPLARALAVAGGFSPRVAWSNAGNLFEWMLGELKAAIAETEAAAFATGTAAAGSAAGAGAVADIAATAGAVIAAGEAVVAARTWPDGRRNVLFEPVRYVAADGGVLRRRRVCCLRYQLPGFGWCENCPTPGVGENACAASA